MPCNLSICFANLEFLNSWLFSLNKVTINYLWMVASYPVKNMSSLNYFRKDELVCAQVCSMPEILQLVGTSCLSYPSSLIVWYGDRFTRFVGGLELCQNKSREVSKRLTTNKILKSLNTIFSGYNHIWCRQATAAF